MRRGGMDADGRAASPGARRRPRGGLEAHGGDVSSSARSVAFHRAAWRRGTGKKTPVPFWACWAGGAGFARATGKHFHFIFCLNFLSFVLACKNKYLAIFINAQTFYVAFINNNQTIYKV